MRVKTKTNKPGTAETLAFSEVKTVHTDTECNELIVKGWIILHAGATHVDNNGYNAKTTFIMGNPKVR
jgi:hypothetical protein